MTDTPFRTPAQKSRRVLGDISNHKNLLSSAKNLTDYQGEIEETHGYAHMACYDQELLDRFDVDASVEVQVETWEHLASPAPEAMSESDMPSFEMAIEEDEEFGAIETLIESYVASIDVGFSPL
mmetsp:Transcript_2079/g.4788  ORF Transcript_2079/g.4788 Transcript_2079/m.4788 type:complete len:124 (+) Transcript_2079:7-378(+)